MVSKSFKVKNLSVFCFDAFQTTPSAIWWIFEKRGLPILISFAQSEIAVILVYNSIQFGHVYQFSNQNALWIGCMCINDKLRRIFRYSYNQMCHEWQIGPFNINIIVYRSGKGVQWCQIENQQSPVYLVNFHSSRHSEKC